MMQTDTLRDMAVATLLAEQHDSEGSTPGAFCNPPTSADLDALADDLDKLIAELMGALEDIVDCTHATGCRSIARAAIAKAKRPA